MPDKAMDYITNIRINREKIFNVCRVSDSKPGDSGGFVERVSM